MSGEVSNAHFLFWDPLHISVTNGARKLKFGTLVGIYHVLAPCIKISSLGGVWGIRSSYFLIWNPLISPKLTELESSNLICWQAFAGIMATYKNLTARGASGEISSAHFLFWDPLHISVTNGVRKLKFGTLVGIYAY